MKEFLRPRIHAKVQRRVLVISISLMLITALGLAILWHHLLPAATDAFPASIAEHDRNEIARACRIQTIRLSVQKIRSGELKFFTMLPKLLNQRICRFIPDGDGACRAYVGYPDKTSTDGYADLWRHQLVKSNAHWQVIRSY